MPDLWDTNPDNVFKTPGEQPSPDRQRPRPSQEGEAQGPRRPPPATRLHLIALVILLVAVLLLLVGVMLAPYSNGNLTRQAAWTAFVPVLQRSVGFWGCFKTGGDHDERADG